jgi:competence protein ComEC
MQSWMIGTVSALVFTGSLPYLPPWPLALLFAAIAVGSLRWKTASARLVCGMACGVALGLGYGTALLQHRVDEACVGVPLVVTGRVSSLPNVQYVRRNQRRQRFEFTVRDLAPVQCVGPRKLILSYYDNHTLHPGEEWQFEVKLRKPWGLANPGSFNMQAWFAQESVDAVGSVQESGSNTLLSPAGGVTTLHHRLRQQISARIGKLELHPDVIAMLQAMTVADNSAINAPLWLLGQQLGINHLLVISGSHIVCVAGAGLLMVGLLVRVLPWSGSWGPGAAQILALVLASLYGALAGFAIPVQRALCTLACFVGAGLAGRRSDPLNSLLLAATVVLLANPLAALGSGFWLSFGAVAALLWLALWQRGVGAFGRLFNTHGFMALVMLPLGALFFGGSSVVAMVANMVMIPLVGLVVVPLSLLAVVCFLAAWPLATELWYLAGWPLQVLLPAARALAESSGKWLYLPLSGDLPQVLLAVLAMALLIIPGGMERRLLPLVLVLPLLLPPVPSWPTPGLDTQVTVLDVGQGTAVVIHSAERTLVYDTGGGDPHGVNMGSTVVLPYLQKLGITALDTLVISHPDLDHSAGTADILDAMAVDRFRYGGAIAETSGGKPCAAGESWRWPGGQVFQFLSPALESARSRNDSSCVLQVQLGDYRLLLPGDIQATQERILVQYWSEQLRSDWLLAAHHGSRTSSSWTFLKRVRPEVAVMSSGYANRFGHPHPVVTQRLQHLGVQQFSTATEGALELRVAPGQAPEVTSFRQLKRRYWM